MEGDHESHIVELTQTYESDMEQIQKELEKSEIVRNEVDREIRKIKKKSSLNSHGGWGTFALVFEDNPKKHHPLILSSSS